MPLFRSLHTLKRLSTMPTITLIHNPKCSKSCAALELLEQKQISPNVVQYLDTPLSVAEISSIVRKLDMKPVELLRKGEPQFSELNLGAANTPDAEIIDAMAKHPNLIERPILIVDDKAVIGRPTEKLNDLLGKL
ncbi:thioredoxin-like protein [Yarrowia lipolytica]|nr:thioredoxin-like protein [Yarrowia lipolytica]KAE8169075.1 thioredoxin-like protein [Yarrowia lipolytica]RMI97270.1 thioredoxin-like protein [Yarrowia lipolytica]